MRSENDGTKGSLGSGVRGGAGGGELIVVEFVLVISAASSSVAELIHFSSCTPTRGGDSGRSLKLSAK